MSDAHMCTDAPPQGVIIREKEGGPEAGGDQLLPLLNPERRAKFAGFVDASSTPQGCWLWTGSASGGYPQFSLGGKPRGAHRVAWVIANGVEIPAGLQIHHTCGRAKCVRPQHLVPATPQENVDAVQQPSEESYRARATAHRYWKEIEPLPFDAGVSFLAWLWKRAQEHQGWRAAPIGSQEREVLGILLQEGEREAYLSLRAAILSWRKFTEYAAEQYGVWLIEINTGQLHAPGRPVIVSKGKASAFVAAIVNYWLDTDEKVAEQRKAEAAAKEIEKNRRVLREYASKLPQ